jgi:hypothetical protein
MAEVHAVDQRQANRPLLESVKSVVHSSLVTLGSPHYPWRPGPFAATINPE